MGQKMACWADDLKPITGNEFLASECTKEIITAQRTHVKIALKDQTQESCFHTLD